MKQVFKYIIIGFALLATAKTLFAQPTTGYKAQGGVATGKSVSAQNADGTYTITLETFATGEQTLVETSTPVDVVLVLDVSGSMDFPKGTTTQVATNTAISYNTVKNSSQEYFYKPNNSNSYYRIYAEQSGGTYYLRYNKAGNSGNGTNLGSSNSASGTIITTNNTDTSGWWEQDNRVLVYTGLSRMTALKDACDAFIDDIAKNDTLDSEGNKRATSLGNQISIVQFAGDENTTVGNTNVTYTDDGNTYNRTKTLIGLTKTDSKNNVAALKAIVNGFVSRGGTMANYGMQRANAVLSGIPSTRESNRVVVMFTDGEPGSSGFSGNNGGSTAVSTISQANTAKGTNKAIVYTVGLFESKPSSNSNVYKYLNAVSSNYTTATGSWSNSTLTVTGTLNEKQDYYKDASGNVDLKAIFQSISQGIGGSTESIPGSTQVRDFITSSFEIPSGSAADNVKVYTSEIAADGKSWKTKVAAPSTVKAEIGKKTYTENGQTFQRDTVGVTNFDFSAEDNWVGLRYPQGSTTGVYAGKKLIIEITVRPVTGATGGDGTATNTAESGVYVLKDGVYVNVNPYTVPHTNLPINLVIKKTGLRHGESATFEIMRCRPEGWDETASVEVNIKEKITYNALGKPNPDGEWESWSKVIITNKGNDDAEVTKTLMALDPNWVYLITEDDWGWSYEMTGTGGTLNTSEVEINPFRFTNTKKTDAVKHAEAVSINHFAPKGSTKASTESYKSSKVNSF